MPTTFDNRPDAARLAAYCARKGIVYDETRDVTVTQTGGWGLHVHTYQTTETALYCGGVHVGTSYADRMGRVHFKAARSL